MTEDLAQRADIGPADGRGDRSIVEVFDTTLRDGEQTPGVGLTVREKVEIARHLLRLRVDVIEAGFAASSPGDFEAVRAVASEVGGGVGVASLARTRHEDIDRAWGAIRDAERPRIHLFLATSPVHMKYKLQLTEGQVLAMADESVRYAVSTGAEVEFSAEDATRSEPDFLCRVFDRAAAAGAHVVNVPDTVGYTTPAEYRRLVRRVMDHLRPRYPGVKISVHCHDDLGLAVANTLSIITVGIDQIETTINGLGERAGNTPLEEVVMALVTRHEFYGRLTRVDTRQIARVSRLVSKLTGIPVQPNKAVVGANAFAHQSGIHQDGVLKQPLTYEIMKPEDIGLSGNSMVLGKLSGRHALRQRLADMGYTLAPARFERVFLRFKEVADRKRVVTERDLEALVEDEIRDGPETIALDSFHVVSGNGAIPTATVRLKVGSESRQEACTGTGPVDAVFRALSQAAGVAPDLRLADYSLKAVTSGEDALGECTLRLESGGRTATGRGASTDVIEASALAYVKALNRLLESGAGKEVASS
ncbi:MAG: 2-isopropylmalate synthase [Bacillota bacterium]|nr:MAG: 2-isopropylmalate synthase [Bacillota bacterium]